MSGMSRRRSFVVIALLLAVLAAGSVRAEIPRKINYQGNLTDSSTGEPETGSHNVIFRVYDDPVAGSLLWSESQTVSTNSAGVFSAMLGSVTPIDISFDGPVWLAVVVDGETLSPRREIASVPYAFQAMNADSLGAWARTHMSLRAGQTQSPAR